MNGGPSLGPILGAALVTNPHLDWRWTGNTPAVWVFTTFTIPFFFLPEVYPLIPPKRRAQQLRKVTRELRYYHRHEHIKLDIHSVVAKQLSRPLIMLCTKPIVTYISIYASFVPA